jgi:hypothetical protein
MSSPLGQYLVQSHMNDLRHEADRRRTAEAARESSMPTVLRSRRFGRLRRIVPASSRPTA